MLKIVPSMLLLWRQAFTILLLSVFGSLTSSFSILLTNLMWHDFLRFFNLPKKVFWLRAEGSCITQDELPTYTFKSYPYEEKHLKVLSDQCATKGQLLPTPCFFLVYSSSVTKWLPASVSITTVTECRLPTVKDTEMRGAAVFLQDNSTV